MSDTAILHSRWQNWSAALLSRDRDSVWPSRCAVTDLLQSGVEDVELLRQIARQDRSAFGRFYDRYANVFFSLALRVLNDHTDAADVVQDVFVQIWNKAATYNPQLGKPFHWASTLTRNKAIDRLRSRRRQFEFIQDLSEDAPEPAFQPSGEEVLSQETAAVIRKALECLPYEQRQAIEMAFLSGLTQDEISKHLQQPLGTIKARIRRGMLKLREALKGVL